MNTEDRLRRVIAAGWGHIDIDPKHAEEAKALADKYERCGGMEKPPNGYSDPDKLWLCTSRKDHPWEHFARHLPERPTLPSMGLEL